jgi:hypothetical protein
MRRVITLGTLVIAVAGALAYLHDPAWLAEIESGFDRWQTSETDFPYRRIAGHASFFVPSDATSIVVPVRTTIEPGDPPIRMSFSIDDRVADEILLTDDAWHAVILRLPAPGTRRHRRIDIRADRLRADQRSAQIGQIKVFQP